MRYFTLEEVLELHFMLIEDYGGAHGVHSEQRLRSLVDAPKLVVYGVEQYKTMYEKAAVYMRNCIADHVFVDGNKRTGVTLGVMFLQRCGCVMQASPRELEDLAVLVAVERLDVDEIAAWLERGC
ncbi:MAG: type II toxin-antitoxin system death-on-curing family toxin [Candidatus Saccharimonadales bacterium]